jgi:hypothetical protein
MVLKKALIKVQCHFELTNGVTFAVLLEIISPKTVFFLDTLFSKFYNHNHVIMIFNSFANWLNRTNDVSIRTHRLKITSFLPNSYVCA